MIQNPSIILHKMSIPLRSKKALRITDQEQYCNEIRRMICIALHNVAPVTTSIRLELGRVDKFANVVLGSHLFEDLLAVVGPESLGSVLTAVLEQDLLSSRVLSQCKSIECKKGIWRRVSIQSVGPKHGCEEVQAGRSFELTSSRNSVTSYTLPSTATQADSSVIS